MLHCCLAQFAYHITFNLCDAYVATRNIEIYCIFNFSVATSILIKIDVSLIVEQMCKNLSPKTRRGNCLVLPHTGYALDAGVPMHAWKMDAKPMLSDDDDEFPSLSSCL